MISVDEGVKVLLIATISICLLMFTIYVSRLLHQLAETVKDSRRIVQNAAHITDLIDKDYTSIRAKVSNIGKGWSIFNAVSGLLGSTGTGGFLGRLMQWQRDKSSEKK